MVPFVLIALMAIAAGFRLWGIRWGLPNALHQWTYHPDELFQVGAMYALNPLKLQFNPGFYNYPSGYMNLGSIFVHTLESYGICKNMTSLYLIARILTAVMGVLTVPVVYGIGSKLYGRSAGLIAAAVFAILPLHIVHSHFATVDVPATLWVAVALFGASWIASGGDTRASILAGLAAGFAAGTKYNVALVIVPVIVAAIMQADGRRWIGRLFNGQLWVSIFSFFAGFVIISPGFVMWHEKFLDGLKYEMSHAQSGHGLVFVGKGPGWFDILSNTLGYGLGVIMLVMVVASVGLALARRKRRDWILLSFMIPYYILISYSQVRFTRYALPLLPPLAIFVGRMMVEMNDIAREHSWKLRRWVWIGLCFFTMAYTATYAVAFTGLFNPPDPRDQAAEWIMKNVPAKTTIAFPTVPWFYSVPLAKEINASVRREDRYAKMRDSKFHLIAKPDLEWDPTLISREKPKYVVVTDFEYEDPLRLKAKQAMEFWKELNDYYTLAVVFEKQLSIVGINFGPAERLPHDLKYQCPTIKVYRRR
jgi:hypothetical protein